MKKIFLPIICSALLVLTSNAWAHGGMGGMGGGMGDFLNDMVNGNRSGMTSHSRRDDEASRNADRAQRENRAFRQHFEATRDIHRAMDNKQDAIDRESHREDPDMSKLNRLHEELDTLRHELNIEQQRFDRYMREYTANDDYYSK